MKAMHEILQKTPEQYEMLLFDFWFRWCQGKAIDDDEFQALLSSPGINLWFLSEMETHELEFRDRIKPFINNATADDLLQCYKTTCVTVFSNWPSAIKSVKKNVAGIKVPLLSYNQN